MAETQASRLITMMHQIQPLLGMEVCLTPYIIKKCSIETLANGDILVLPTSQLEVEIFGEDRRVIAEGLCGMYGNTFSVSVKEQKSDEAELGRSSEYESLKISLGTIEKRDFAKGKIVKLYQKKGYDAALHRGETLVAYAYFVRIDEKVALQIKEVE